MKLKLEAKLCRIKGNSSETILDEFEDFEKQMRRTEVPTWKRIYKYFEAVLRSGLRACSLSLQVECFFVKPWRKERRMSLGRICIVTLV